MTKLLFMLFTPLVVINAPAAITVFLVVVLLYILLKNPKDDDY